MQQLELLAIRQQPAPREIPLPSKVIRQYVREKLRGFTARQLARELRRVRKEARKHMRAIKVSYRAEFEQPTGALNPMGMKLPGLQRVEIFQTGATWKARSIATGQIYTRLEKFASRTHAQSNLEANFERRLTEWEIWGKPPEEAEPRKLLPKEIRIASDGQVFWRQAEDFTHILHAPNIPPGAHVPPAACGAKVNVKCFISTKANIEPTCEPCAEIWRKEYRGK